MDYEDYSVKIFKTACKWVGILTVLVLLFTVFRPWVSIPSGHTGVVTHFGKVVNEELGEGIHLITPVYTKVTKFDNRVMKTDVTTSAASKDLQTVTSSIVVNHHARHTASAELYQRVGMDYQSKVVEPAIHESIKAVTARYTADELISKRREVATETEQVMTEKLEEYNIVVDKFNIVNFQFSEAFNNAIEAKQEAEQLALKAQRDLERIEIEAQQQITQAKAQAEALRLQKQEVTPELLKLREIENQKEAIAKWNGILPQVTSDAVPLINVGK